MIKIELTENQAWLVLKALSNESIGDMTGRGEYSYYRCLKDIQKKMAKDGFEVDL